MGALLGPPACAAEPATVIPPPTTAAASAGDQVETAVLAGGCFWGVQAVFQHVKGVRRAVSGYSGGTKDTADYDTVTEGDTGHAESVQVTFDPREISYGKILQIYFSVAHNPTELNYQGPDHGEQYRSVIFYADDEQQRVAKAYIAQLDKAGVFKHPIVTTVERLSAFYPAEDYHQDYAIRHPHSSYIAHNDRPKVENLKRLFRALYRESPVTVIAAGTASK
jgi:peptide-methionine (S)-S-oxide reductase